MTNSHALNGGDADADLGVRYAQALQQYVKLAQSFDTALAGHPNTTHERVLQRAALESDLSRWFQESVYPREAGSTRYWQRWSELILQSQLAHASMAAILVKAGNAAAARFVATLDAAIAQSEPAVHVAKLYERWIQSAENTYAEMAHSAEYAHLLAALTNLDFAIQAEQCAMLAQWARQTNQPTREEVDRLISQVSDLRQQLTALQLASNP